MTFRVRQRSVFEELRARGTRVRSGSVRMIFLPLETTEPQVAFAFGRRFGPAVERNRARRRLRAAFEAAWRRGDPLGAYQLAGSRAVLDDRFDRLVAAVRSCVDELAARHRNLAPTVDSPGPAAASTPHTPSALSGTEWERAR